MTSEEIDMNMMNVKFECTLDRSTGKLDIKNKSDGMLPPGVAVIALLNVSSIITQITSKVYSVIIAGKMEEEEKEEKKPGDDAESEGKEDAVSVEDAKEVEKNDD